MPTLEGRRYGTPSDAARFLNAVSVCLCVAS